MRICSLVVVLMVWLAPGLPVLGQEPAQTPVFKSGFAERDITPEIGMEQPGGYGKSFHRSLHDPCKVRAVVFDDGQKRVAIVGIDALVIRRPQVVAAREGISQRCGIPPEQVLISASHSHSSGPTGMVLPGEFDHASAEVQRLAYQASSMADEKYLTQVETAIIEAVCEADEKRTEALAGAGYGIEDQVAFNRRFRMRNGRTQTHPRQGNPEIVEPAGPIDPQVGVIGSWDKEGKLQGCVVNYACHATTSPGGISANYVWFLEKVIRGTFGEHVVVVFLPGCCGDITQVDNQSPFENRGSEDWCRFVGGRIGAEAVKVLLTMDRGSLGPVDAKTKTLRIKRRVPSPERLAKAWELVKKEEREVGHTEWIFAKELVLLDALLENEPIRETEVQAMQVGPVVLLTNPAEFFCEFGLEQKQRSGFPITFPVELANDCVGYVPTEEALSETGGGYETRLTSYSNLEPTAGRQFVEATLEMAKGFKPGVMPSRPLVKTKGAVWEYGAPAAELE
jgi:neutral ceramidase